MSKIYGIKSVDFKIEASGYGVVNWNGPIKLNSSNGIVENHSLPKLRGFTNKIEKENKEDGKLQIKYMFIEDIDLTKTPLYISQNCIRHHLFKDQAYDLHFLEPKGNKKNDDDVNDDNMIKLLSSITGLVRGFVLPTKSQFKRTSALLITDFVDELGQGNFEQFTRSGPKESKKDTKKSDNSLFSKTTFGDTKYTAFGSISIEQLQFISLDNKFDRAAWNITNRKIDQDNKLVESIQSFIKSLDTQNRNPKVTYHENYIRKGTIFVDGEVGLLLDDIACDILVQETLNRIKNLVIKQAKGYMKVDKVNCDYNSSDKMFRIKENSSEIIKEKEAKDNYAIYFEGK